MKNKRSGVYLLKSSLLICLIALGIMAIRVPLGKSVTDSNEGNLSREFDFSNLRSLMDQVAMDGDNVQLVIGIPANTTPTACAGFVEQTTKRGAKHLNTISVQGKAIAIVVSTPLEAAASFANELKETIRPRYVEPNFKRTVNFAPSDEYWSYQWAPKKIMADWAWNTTTGSNAVLVAVVDTGIDYGHPDLAGNYVPLGYNWVADNWDPKDDFGHGTHCAGIIAATINNNIGVAGLAQVRIMAEKVLDSSGNGNDTQIAEGIINATNAGARIISMSLCNPMYSSLVHDAVKYAHDAGVLIVASAGNDNCPGKSYPAGYDEVIAVTATDSSDQPADFTNYGYWVELAAPGVNVFSTMPTYNVTMNHESYGYAMNYDYMDGTSMACPHVAGIAALVLSRYPTMSVDQLRYYLRYTADDLGPPGFDEYYGYGRVNARKAIEQGPPSHDLALLNWSRPSYVVPGLNFLNATVLNFGSTTETNVNVQLFANGTNWGTQTIPSLISGDEATVGWLWLPTTGNTYNLTVYVVPAAGEVSIENNKNMGLVWPQTGIVKVPECYPHIQQAIDIAVAGDRILVGSGTYRELVDVYKPYLSIIGENRWTTIVDGCGTCHWGFIVQGDNTTVSGFTVQNTFHLSKGRPPPSGILIYSSSNNTIADNYVTNNYHGILLYGSMRNTISRNVVTSCLDTGILARGGDTCTITENIVKSNVEWGIILWDINCCAVYNNTVAYTWGNDAILIFGGDQNQIIDNNVLSNMGLNHSKSEAGFGIAIINVGETLVRQNYICNNTYGFRSGSGNGNNRIYHNNFINNMIQLYEDPAATDNWTSIWDCEGNYWSDYTGIDVPESGTQYDGIGDTNVPHQGVDNHPLMSPWYTGDLNHDGNDNILDIIIISNAYGARPGDANWNPHADVNEDGVTDDIDLNITMAEYEMTSQSWWNRTLTVLAVDPNNNTMTDLSVWVDDQLVGHTGSSFSMLKGMHQVKVQQTYTAGTHSYGFLRWEDGSKENPRLLMVCPSKTLTAYYALINNAPEAPSQPSGPSSGYFNSSYIFTTNTTDPENDNLNYQFSWGDNTTTTVGPFTSGATANASHSWTTIGTYQVTARAQDTYGAWSNWSSSQFINIVNAAPNTPTKPSGPTSGYADASYSYSTSTTDPDNENVRYQFDWGDNSATTTGYYASGSTASATHTWGSTGTYYLKVKAQDVSGAWSGWSASLTVIISDGDGGYPGCPTLFSFNGKGYEKESLLDIHDSRDVTVDYALKHLQPVGRCCMLSLRELDTFTSHIDCVKLYAVDAQGTWYECKLVMARQSQFGLVTSELLQDDDIRINLTPGQTTELTFLLPKGVNVNYFVFELNGYNRKVI